MNSKRIPNKRIGLGIATFLTLLALTPKPAAAIMYFVSCGPENRYTMDFYDDNGHWIGSATSSANDPRCL